jgi:hypothetical protein
MQKFILLFTLILTVNYSFAQLEGKVDGFALQNCGSLKALRQYDITQPGVVLVDEMTVLKTTKQPIYIEVLVPPKHPEEWISIYQPLLPSNCKKCKKFVALSYGLPNTKSCYIINPNDRRNVYIYAMKSGRPLKLKTLQMNPESEETKSWFRYVKVESVLTPGHIIEFLVYQVPGTGQ